MYCPKFSSHHLQNLLQVDSKVAAHRENGLFIYKTCSIWHQYVYGTYGCVSPTHGELALTLYRRRVKCFIHKTTSYRAVNTFHLDYKNQSVYVI
jgi:hypothetical protein